MKIVSDNTIPYLKGVVESLADIKYISSIEFTPENIKDAEVLIVRSIDKCTKELLEGSQIKLITSATIGFDHIDTEYCESHGIVWKNAPGCNANSVAQYIVSNLIRLSLHTKEDLSEKTIGIIGVGHVGSKVEKVCRALGMKVLLNDPPRKETEQTDQFVPLSQIAEEADIITLHTPLTKKGAYPTFHLANEPFFQSLQKQPWFINAARGAITDTTALLKAKEKGLITELVIDCWENEPDINRDLLKAAYIATPHIAGFSADGKSNATRICLETIEAFYHIKFKDTESIVPASPSSPIIDLSHFKTDRIANAILACFDPISVSWEIRKTPERFEWLRAHYNHPREYHAYTIINASEYEATVLKKLGFSVL